MRPITRYALKVLQGEEWDPVELLEIRPAGATEASTIRLCSAGGSIASGSSLTFDGDVYTAMVMSRGNIEEVLSTDSSDVPSITMTIGNVDKQMASLLAGFELEGAEATLRVCDRRLLSTPRNAIDLALGEITNLQLSDATLVFQIVGIMGQLQGSTVPKRLWQQKCSYTYGSPACLGATPSFDPLSPPLLVTTTALSGSTERYIRIPAQALTDAGDPDDPTGYWSAGYILFTTGRLATQARQFQRYDLSAGHRRIYPRTPFLLAPEPGDQLIIKKGCAKDKVDCANIQGHVLNYGGFEESPFIGVKISRTPS